ncbi:MULTISPECIES: hypothetical protein [Aphanothece]|uniref:hypothetical protein n=1 Tax=Aphanothece TaxID=1121 RepID=UPI003985321E
MTAKGNPALGAKRKETVMNTQNYEILAGQKGGERTYWTRIGTAFPTRDGKGFRLKLNFIPAAAETDILVLPPKPQPGAETTEEFDDPLFPFDPARVNRQ